MTAFPFVLVSFLSVFALSGHTQATLVGGGVAGAAPIVQPIAEPVVPIAPVTPVAPLVQPVAPVAPVFPVAPVVQPVVPVTPVVPIVQVVQPVVPVVPVVQVVRPVVPVVPVVQPGQSTYIPLIEDRVLTDPISS